MFRSNTVQAFTRVLILLGFLLLLGVAYRLFFSESKKGPIVRPVDEAVVESAPTVTPAPSPSPKPSASVQKKPEPSVNERKIEQTKAKKEIGYKELERAFISNKVCDFAEIQELLPIDLTVKILMSRGSSEGDDFLLNDGFNVATAIPKTEAGRFFKAIYLAGLDDAHPNPQPDLKEAEKMLRALNIDSSSNVAYIVFLYQVLKLRDQQLPDLVDELVNRSLYDAHVYEIKRELQRKAGTVTSLHAASLIEKELPRPNFVKLAELIENETRFAARDEAQSILAASDRMLEKIERDKPLALAQFPTNEELIPRKLNEAARNYLLMEGRDSKPTETPPSLNETVDALKKQVDETGFETKHCETRPANNRYEWMKKHR